MSTDTNQREELAREVWLADRVRAAAPGGPSDADRAVADRLIAKGYRKPSVLGYVVVDRAGRRVPGASYTNRETAQAYADRWSNEAKANRLDLDYRVAEIVEATR